ILPWKWPWWPWRR
nr:indolicidin=antimicrobial peptide [cattle, neutrophils, Peptide, 13 aa] [Bos taurus]